jgi:hypothetical protein
MMVETEIRTRAVNLVTLLTAPLRCAVSYLAGPVYVKRSVRETNRAMNEWSPTTTAPPSLYNVIHHKSQGPRLFLPLFVKTNIKICLFEAVEDKQPEGMTLLHNIVKISNAAKITGANGSLPKYDGYFYTR